MSEWSYKEFVELTRDAVMDISFHGRDDHKLKIIYDNYNQPAILMPMSMLYDIPKCSILAWYAPDTTPTVTPGLISAKWWTDGTRCSLVYGSSIVSEISSDFKGFILMPEVVPPIEKPKKKLKKSDIKVGLTFVAVVPNPFHSNERDTDMPIGQYIIKDNVGDIGAGETTFFVCTHNNDTVTYGDWPTKSNFFKAYKENRIIISD